MSEIQGKKTRQKRVAFKGMLANIFNKLKEKELKTLRFIYDENIEDISDGIELADRLINREYLGDCMADLNILKENLLRIERNDLKKVVDEYIKQRKPPQNSPEHSLSSYTISMSQVRMSFTKDLATDENYDYERSTVSAIGFQGRGKKRPRVETQEEKDLEEAASMMLVCDSTTDSPDELEACADRATTKDKEHMKKAQDAAKNSKDEETKVGAVFVDPNDGTVLGTGWNRMPEGCEERFRWDRNREVDPLEEGKHLYVVYAIRAAIVDASKQKNDLEGSILYTTLFPSNICAQFIRDMRVKEVVYVSDKFRKTKFMKASRRILEGIECRPFNDKDCNSD